jgi:hypothetical protein
VRDQAVKDQLGDLQRETALPLLSAADRLRGTGHPQEKVLASSALLAWARTSSAPMTSSGCSS